LHCTLYAPHLTDYYVLTPATRLPAHQLPELHRVPLERVVLRVKRLYADRPAAAVLALLPDPPASAAVRSAVGTLVALGALNEARHAGGKKAKVGGGGGGGGGGAGGGGGGGNGGEEKRYDYVLPLITHRSLLTAHYSLLTTHHSLLTTTHYYSLLTTTHCYSLLTTHYRYDVDGVLYSRDDFIAEYGGAQEWEQAEAPAAPAPAAAPAAAPAEARDERDMPNEELTALGYHLATLPVDVRIGKLILLGAVLGCTAPTAPAPSPRPQTRPIAGCRLP
jgi:hypothetical protein